MKRLGLFLFLISAAAVVAQPVRGLAWAWVSAASSNSTPDSGYQYNSAGGAITVVWDTIGSFTVSIPNMGASATGNQGTAHAVAYNGNHHCHATGWAPGTPATTEAVTVQCYDPAGARANGQFQVLYYKESRTAAEWNDGYLWADRPTLTNYTPDLLNQWNSKGTANTVTRSSAGRYRAIFSGLNSKVKHFGNVLVDAYGQSVSTHCQSTGWGQVGADQYVDVACNTAAGVASDTRFILSFFSDVAFGVQTGDQQLRGAYFVADQPAATSAYVPSLLTGYNGAGGLNRVTRQSVGTYLVELPGMISVNSASAMVREFNSSGYCGLGLRPANQPAGEASVMVTCFTNAGVAADLQFTMLYLTNQAATSALPISGGPDRAKGWATVSAAGSVGGGMYNSTGGSNSAAALGTGMYRVSFPGLGTSGGVAYANATQSNAYCQPVVWGPNGTGQDVYVMCYAPDGTVVNAASNVLFYKESRLTTAWNSGYAKANLPISEAAYNSSSAYSWNAKNSQNTVARVSEGNYMVTFPGIGGAGGGVMVSPQGVVPAKCKVASWAVSGADETVGVACYNFFGTPQDSEFTVSYFNDVAFATDVAANAHQGAYAFADSPAAAAYTPVSALNSTGGGVSVSRAAAGAYTVRLGQLGATPTLPVVTSASSQLGDYCQTGSWAANGASGVDVAVNCYGSTGALADSQFAIAYLTSQAPPPVFTMTTTHSGSFLQGGAGTFTINMSNAASAAASSGTLTLTFNLPGGFSVGSAAGTGWTCGGASCTYSNSVAAGTSAPALTLQVNVAATATPGVGNTVSPSLSGGGLVGSVSGPDTPTVVALTTTSVGVISNRGTSTGTQALPVSATVSAPNYPGNSAATSGTVTFTMKDTGSATVATLGSLAVVSGTASGTMTIPANQAAGSYNVSAVYSGGGLYNGSTSSPVSFTILAPTPTPVLAMAKSHTGNFTQGQSGVWGLVVTNTSSGSTDGSLVTVTDFLPSGFAMTSFSGGGWTCSGSAAVSCTTNAVVAGGGTFPAITLTVGVPSNAAASVTNTAQVFGGGDVSHTSAANAAVSNTDTVTVLASSVTTPAVVGFSPAAGNAQAQPVTAVFSDPGGFANLSVVNVLINNGLDGRNACYVAYSRAANTLFLVADDGGTLLPGMALNGSGSVSNAQCTITGAGTSAVGSGNTLTLTMNVIFSTSFVGDRVIFLAARNASSGNSGWNTRGVWRVPGAAPALNVTSFGPGSGAGTTSTFTATFTDAAGGTNISNAQILINKDLNGDAACYVGYARSLNLLYLVDDGGPNMLLKGPVTPGSGTGSMSNSQCTVTGAGTTAVVSGNTLTLSVNVTFKAGFGGYKVAYAASQNAGGANTDWHASSLWLVQ